VKYCNLFGMILLHEILQLVWNDSFARCATAAANSFLPYRMPGFSNRTCSNRLEYPILFSISIQKNNLYIKILILYHMFYISRMIWAQENLAKFGYRSEMKVEKFRNGAIFWPHA
jgi:hypothetical protein